MKLGFSAAIVASLSLSLVSVPAASQTIDCTELRAQERAASQEMGVAYRNLLAFSYDFKKSDLQFRLEMAYYYCEHNNAPGMDLECKQEMEEYHDELLQELDDEKAALEAEVSAADSAWEAATQQLIEAHC